jgi:asparagine synthase (glutamine-hydrolysing)
MCGICGFVQWEGDPIAQETLANMLGALSHRGPDGSGIYLKPGVGLAHHRLAVLDLTAHSAQPMGTDVILSYNGEIYNPTELRRSLESAGQQMFTRGDAELVLKAYLTWGPDCLSRLNGMFAFACWEPSRKRLFLARDRYGVKPLYFTRADGLFGFASEIKSLLRLPGVKARVNLSALHQYFTFQNTLTPETLFSGISILEAGTFMLLDGLTGDSQAVRYWDYPLDQPKLTLDPEEASQQVAHLLTQAVHRQLSCDVPVSTYLSGGLDSGAIASIASQRLAGLPSFTCGFDLDGISGLELNFDERAEAEELASLLKTEHYEVILHSGDMERVLAKIVWHLEDLRVGQCYPNYYVSRLASRFAKVVLSGVGGDELFAGYPWRYRTAHEVDFPGQYFQCWQRLVNEQDLAKLFRPDRFLADFRARDIFEAVLQGVFGGQPESLEEKLDTILYFELKTFLHGLLVVEDRLSMAHGLEVRVPFLDNDLVDFACQLGALSKVPQLAQIPDLINENDPTRLLGQVSRSRQGKSLLRQALVKLLPGRVVNRPKQGFSGPDASWFRGQSQDFVNLLLQSKETRIYEYLAPELVQQRLSEHFEGRQNHRLFIWSLLSFEFWLRHFIHP